VDSDRSTPPPADEAAALDQLERAEAAVRAAPTRRVLWRASVMMDRLLRAPELEQAARDFGAALDRIRAEIQARGLPPPSDEEIDAEIQAVRVENAAWR
jgi:hypothetical protein